MTSIRRHEVFYTLERENHAKTVCLPIATYPAYLDALEDGRLLDVGGWHHKIKRHSNPIFGKS